LTQEIKQEKEDSLDAGEETDTDGEELEGELTD
jgi:hypothetical protein